VAEAHEHLVSLAARWLRATRKCALVATERNARQAGEAPDAIGWLPDGSSILVECKTSLGDFYADRRKPSRTGAPAMGRERWYLTEDGLLAGRELPPGWGWLAVRHGRVFRAIPAVPNAKPSTLAAELPLLVALCRNALGGFRDGVTPGGAGSEDDPEAPLPLLEVAGG
jgi:hypothetical protein